MNGMEPRVAIVVLNWNNLADTRDCLDSLRHLTYGNHGIVLVDNGSSDNSVEAIRREFPEVTVVENGKNLGFAEGNNVGVRLALAKLAPQYVVLLNNDTIAEPGLLMNLVSTAQADEKIGLVQSKILYPDRQINTTGGYCDIFGGTMHRGVLEPDAGQYDSLTESGFFYANGASLLVSRNLLVELGNDVFDNELFAYYEDVDLSWSARLLGYKVAYCPRSVCIHKGMRSSRWLDENVTYWIHRNRLRVMMKNYTLPNLLLMVPLAVLLELVSSLVLWTARRDIRAFKNFVKALLWNVKVFEGTLWLRKVTQSKRKVSDGEVMTYMVKRPIEIRMLIQKVAERLFGIDDDRLK